MCRALARISSPAVTARLVQRMDMSDPTVRCHTSEKVRHLPSSALCWPPTTTSVARSGRQNSLVVVWAALGLGDAGPPALPTLLLGLDHRPRTTLLALLSVEPVGAASSMSRNQSSSVWHHRDAPVASAIFQAPPKRTSRLPAICRDAASDAGQQQTHAQ